MGRVFARSRDGEKMSWSRRSRHGQTKERHVIDLREYVRYGVRNSRGTTVVASMSTDMPDARFVVKSTMSGSMCVPYHKPVCDFLIDESRSEEL